MRYASALLAFFVAALFWEAIDRNFVSYHPECKILPNKTEVLADRCVNSEEGYSICSFSDQGYRRPVPPDTSDPKVLVLGDSYCAASQVGDEQTFCNQLQVILKHQYPNVGVWNAGINGAAPSRYIGMADYYKQNFRPDMVIIQLNAGDFYTDMDSRSATFWLEPTKEGWQINKNDVLVTRGSLKKLAKYPLAQRVAACAFESAMFQQLVTKIGQEFGAMNENAGESQGGKDESDIYIKHAKWVVDELAKTYPTVAVVYIPTLDYFKLDKPPAPQEFALQDECRKRGIPFANLRPSFEQEFVRTGQSCNGFLNTAPGQGHINALGHRLVAERMSELASMLLDKRSSNGNHPLREAEHSR